MNAHLSIVVLEAHSRWPAFRLLVLEGKGRCFSPCLYTALAWRLEELLIMKCFFVAPLLMSRQPRRLQKDAGVGSLLPGGGSDWRQSRWSSGVNSVLHRRMHGAVGSPPSSESGAAAGSSDGGRQRAPSPATPYSGTVISCVTFPDIYVYCVLKAGIFN